MGLDMYACVRDTAPPSPVDFDSEDPDEKIFYWRKHPDLHGWMERLYRWKGGKQEFNLDPVLLTAEDLDDLERSVTTNELPKTSGFFFGSSIPQDKEDTLEFIEKARDAIADGKFVYYTSWW